MQNARRITENTTWVGCDDKRTYLFENLFPIPEGISYNSYIITDEKTALLDTVDATVAEQFMENLNYVLKDRTLDYLIIQHMEPDHSAIIARLVRKYPTMQLVVNAKTAVMVEQFFEEVDPKRFAYVKEGDSLNLGVHTLRFYMAPMVNWPEVMVTYDEHDKILFSADAFGVFGALNGNLFDDGFEVNETVWKEARRYYSNIVGKYGVQVQALLKKAAGLEIHRLCPLHGPVWSNHIGEFIERYDKWSRYEPEDKEVIILCGSIYGHTQDAANKLAMKLSKLGVANIKTYDVSRTHASELIGEIFRASHLVLACATYNGGIYTPMENLLSDMKGLAVQNRTVALIENGTWAPMAAREIRKRLEEMKNMCIMDNVLTIKSVLKQSQEGELEAFARQIVDSLNK